MRQGHSPLAQHPRGKLPHAPGRCSSCSATISPIYPIVELLTASLGLALHLRYGLTPHFFILALLCAALIVVAFIDLKHQIIPDEISVTGIFVGFSYSLFSTKYLLPATAVGLTISLGTLLLLFGPQLCSVVMGVFRKEAAEPCEESEFRLGEYVKILAVTIPGIVCCVYALLHFPGQNWADSLLGILVGTDVIVLSILLYYLLRRAEGMGGGDIKLLAMLGAFFGWQAIPFIIFVSSLAGSIIGLTVMLVKKEDGKLAIPFGPFLVIGALLHIFYGPQIVGWYFSTWSH